MKKTLRLLSLVIALLMTFALVSCTTQTQNGTGTDETKDAAEGTAQNSGDAAGHPFKVGVIQYLSHPSLDNCYAGVEAALKESGLDYELVYKTGSNNSAESDCASFAGNMVADRCDLIVGIATPAAKSAFTATADTYCKVIFCAVSDPVSAGLVNALDAPGVLCSGTSDVLDFDAQIALIKTFQPDVKKIGVLYTSSEENSISQLASFTEVCKANGIEVYSKAVQNASDIPSAAEDVASQVDCINNFTDNNVVNNLSVLLEAAERYGIPVYGSEEEQVKNGCLASVSIDYVALGKVTGEMAVEVLKGADITAMAVRTISEGVPVVNSEVASAFGYDVEALFASASNAPTLVGAPE